MSFKALDRTDVEASFDELLNKNGKVTSLEVKEDLRQKGFWATQAIVGVALREIADTKGIDWDFNGTFRTYYQPGTQMSPTSATVLAGLTPAAPVVVTPKPQRQPADPQDREPIDTPATGDWKCTDQGSNPLYFKSKLKAEQARYAYALQTGVDYVNVRSVRV